MCRGGRPLFVSHAHQPVDYAKRLPSPLVDMPPGSHATYVNYAGEEVIGVSLPIRGVPWMYIAEEPVEVAFGELGEHERRERERRVGLNEVNVVDRKTNGR